MTSDPVPVSVTFGTGLEELLVTLSVALKAPAAFGENCTLMVVLDPAVTVAGRAGETKEKYLVVIAALLIVTSLDPELVAVTDSVLLVPVSTLPKSRLETLSDRPFGC